MTRSRHKHVGRVRSAGRRRLTRMGLAASAVLAAAPPVAAVVWPDDAPPGSAPTASSGPSEVGSSPWPMRATPHSEAPALLEAQTQVGRSAQASRDQAARRSGERRDRQADARAAKDGQGQRGEPAGNRVAPVAQPGRVANTSPVLTAAGATPSAAPTTPAASDRPSTATSSAPAARQPDPAGTASATTQGTAVEGPALAWDDPLPDADPTTSEPTPAEEPTSDPMPSNEPTPYATSSPEVCVGVGPGRVTPQKLARAGCTALPY